jgi:hypothetical protein
MEPDPPTTRPENSRSFLGIPAALRLRIYRHHFLAVHMNAFFRIVAVRDTGETWESSRGHGLLASIQKAHRTDILRICRQVHDEALPVMYELIGISLHIGAEGPHPNFMQDYDFFPPRYHLIRNLDLIIEYDSSLITESIEQNPQLALVRGVLQRLGQGDKLQELGIYIMPMPEQGNTVPEGSEFPMRIFENLRFRGSGPKAATISVPPFRSSGSLEARMMLGEQTVALLRAMQRHMRVKRFPSQPHPLVDLNGF